MDRASLRLTLDSHHPTDPTERHHLQRMHLLLDAPDPFARSHYSPGHFTASAFILDPDRSALLLIHHDKLDRWLQPGGHLEQDDTDTLAAARREAREEVGLEQLELIGDGPFDVDIHAIPANPKEPAHEHFDIRYLLCAPARQHRAGDGVRAARWFPFEQLAAGHDDDSIERVLGKLMAHLG